MNKIYQFSSSSSFPKWRLGRDAMREEREMMSGMTRHPFRFAVALIATLVTFTSGSALRAAPMANLVAPTVTGLSPSAGSALGGTVVTITGTNFTGATAVVFGAANAPSFTVNSATSITATTPAFFVGLISGFAQVSVTTPGGSG